MGHGTRGHMVTTDIYHNRLNHYLMRTRDNEEGSVGALFGFILGLALCGVIVVFMGPVIDPLLGIGGGTGIGPVVSQERVDTLNLLGLSWKAIPFVFLFGWGIWYLKTQLAKYGGVD